MNRLTIFIFACILSLPVLAQTSVWPETGNRTRPGTRWWWMGSAVDSAGLTRALETYSKAGIGTVEITPIYGVQGNEDNEISFLSQRWMAMLQHCAREASRLGMQIDMNTGTGWPFGGPEVTPDEAASRLLIAEYRLNGGERLTDEITVADPKQQPFARLSRLMAFSDRGERLDLTALVKNGALDWTAPTGRWRLIAAWCGKTLQKQLHSIRRLQRQGRILQGEDYARTLSETGIVPETIKSLHGLQYVRRADTDGHHYFISALKPGNTDTWIRLAVPAASAVLYDPMTGKYGKAQLRRREGRAEIRLQLASGESVIVKTYRSADADAPSWPYLKTDTAELSLDKGWTLRFVESEPSIDGAFVIDTLCPWTALPIAEARVNSGTALYETVFRFVPSDADEWVLDLGDVRETARVRINGQDAGTVWAVPYRLRIGQFLHPGANRIEIEVTGLPANRIADYDRKGVVWRRFKEINMVDLHYKNARYDTWGTVPQGLNGTVKLIPARIDTASSPQYLEVKSILTN